METHGCRHFLKWMHTVEFKWNYSIMRGRVTAPLLDTVGYQGKAWC